MVSSRLSADERRTAVLAAAISEFALAGYAGTSTDAIASRAGISQPYLFRLFGTKKDLFIATYELVSARIVAAMTRASDGLAGEEALAAMGGAYVELVGDPELLQVEMHGMAAAAGDPDIAACCRQTFAALWALAADRTGLPDDRLREFFSMGMMLNVIAALDLLSVSESWATSLCPGSDADIQKLQAVRRAADAVKRHREADQAATEEASA